MKAITLWDPWATLMMLGEKRIETRSWNTDYRGLLAIHAAKHTPRLEFELMWDAEGFRNALLRHFPSLEDAERVMLRNRGRIIAVMRLYETHSTDWMKRNARLQGGEEMFGNYEPGRVAWITTNVTRVDDLCLEVRGRQQLWDVPIDKERRQGALCSGLWRAVRWYSVRCHSRQ